MKRILYVVGKRPNFVKLAPIMREMAQHPARFEHTLVRTWQHCDTNVSADFFNEGK